MNKELLHEVRHTETLEGRWNVYPYATIEIREFDPNDVKPTAKYVLKKNLERLEAFQKQLDIFQLEERIENNRGIISPPVVEKVDGEPAIVDGIHRFYLARRQGKKVKAIYIEGADPSIPVISHTVGWDEVKEYETKPENPSLLRNMRVEDNDDTIRQYYRDLSYLGSDGRRKREGQ